jgi:hypothetical protein
LSAIRWSDEKTVVVISAFSSVETQPVSMKSGQGLFVLLTVNKHMGDVDKEDQVMQKYFVEE